jgi:hypothetical protein
MVAIFISFRHSCTLLEDTRIIAEQMVYRRHVLYDLERFVGSDVTHHVIVPFCDKEPRTTILSWLHPCRTTGHHIIGIDDFTSICHVYIACVQ